MKRSLLTMSKGVLLSGAITLGVFASPAQAQVEIRLFPPVTFRVTNRPVFHDGHAAYWYQNRWYYRDGGQWRYYHDEPRYLREYRTNRVHVRQHYEPNRRHRGGHKGR